MCEMCCVDVIFFVAFIWVLAAVFIFFYSLHQEIEVDFFQAGYGVGLILSWSGPGVPNLVAIPASAFRCNPHK